MKKLFLLLLLASPCMASSAKHSFQDPLLNDEFDNVYFRIDSSLKGNVRVSSVTITTATISNLKGVTNGSNACTGCVGEIISASVVRSVAASISGGSGAVNTITSISLPAGDWDVFAMVGFTGSGITFTTMQGGISTTAATMPVADTAVVPDATGQVKVVLSGNTITGVNDYAVPPLRSRVSISATTTYYLVAGASFSVSTPAIYGSIVAMRRH